MKNAIKDAVKTAMKAQDKVKLEAARLLLSAIQYEEMQKQVDELPADAISAVLQREIGRRREEIEYAEKAGRTEAVEKLQAEIKFIEGFLPKQLSSDELEKIIVDIKGENPGSNMGSVMKVLKERYAGQYDGKTASDVAKRVLS